MPELSKFRAVVTPAAVPKPLFRVGWWIGTILVMACGESSLEPPRLGRSTAAPSTVSAPDRSVYDEVGTNAIAAVINAELGLPGPLRIGVQDILQLKCGKCHASSDAMGV